MIVRRLVFVLLFVAACTGPTTDGSAADPTLVPTSSVSSTSSAVPTSTTTTGAVEDYALVLSQVDPRTLAAIPAEGEIGVGEWLSYAIDDDSGLLAVLSGSESYRGMLRVFDLNWQVRSGPVPANDPYGSLRLGTDGAAYWLEPPDGHPGAFQLLHLPPGTAQIVQVATLPDSFVPFTLKWLSADGDRYVVLGFETADGLAGGPASLVAVDTSTGTVERRQLDIAVGISSEEQIDQVPVFDRYQPGLAVDELQALLYVVHADRDHLTVIDLNSLETVREEPILEAQSVVDRLLAWWIPPAHAKLDRGTNHTAVLGPDGLLYVASSMTDAGTQTDGRWTQETTPLGIRVIDPQSAREVGRVDLPVDQTLVSPDGRLAATGSSTSWLEGENTKSQPSGVYLIDLDKLEVAHHIPPAEGKDSAYLQGISPDGTIVYVQSFDWSSGEAILEAIDLDSGEMTGHVTSSQGPSIYVIPELSLLAVPLG